MTSAEASLRTRTAARIVGPYLIVMGVTLIARQETMALLLPAFMQDGPLVLAAGAFTLMAGLTLLAAHHHWDGAAAIIITLVGIAAALKGAWLMIAPDWGAALTADFVRAPAALLIAGAAEILLGLWLSFIGWASSTSSSSNAS
ncbi:MAG: hypothetical protein AB7O04_06370 [Hyphomonadaceae bacterium]